MKNDICPLIIFFTFFLITTSKISAQEPIEKKVLDTPFNVNLRLSVDFDDAAHKILYYINDTPKLGIDINASPKVNEQDKRIVNLRMNVPLDEENIGKLVIKVVQKADETRDLMYPIAFYLITPAPVINSIKNENLDNAENEKILWNHKVGSVKLLITGNNLFLDNNTGITINDPFISVNMNAIHMDQNNVSIDVNLSERTNPGFKEIKFTNKGGLYTTKKINLISTVVPTLINVQKSKIKIGQEQRFILDCNNAQNIESIYIGTENNIVTKLKNTYCTLESVDASKNKMFLNIYIPHKVEAGYKIFALTKNQGNPGLELANFSELFDQESLGLNFEPVNQFEGYKLDKIIFNTNKNSVNLNETDTYHIVSEKNHELNCKYNKNLNSLILNEPLELKVEHRGNWNLKERSNATCFIKVKAIPKIESISWEHSHYADKELFGNKPYATKQNQTYKLTMRISKLDVNDFPVSDFDFFGGFGSIVPNSFRRGDDYNNLETYTCEIKLNQAIVPGEFEILHKPTGRSIYTQTFLPYSSPVKQNDFIFLNVADSKFDLNLASEYRIPIIVSGENLNSISINIDPSGFANYGNQYLKIYARLFNNEHILIGEFEDELTNYLNISNLQFKENLDDSRVTEYKVTDWYSIEFKVEHQLNKYSPNLETVQNQDDYAWYNEYVIEGGRKSRFIKKLSITSPIQQSVYIIEKDSLSASLYNIGINKIWYKRRDGFEQTKIKPFALGLGIYTSELDKLVESQNLRVGVALLANYQVENLAQFAVGIGPSWSYYFKDINNGKDKGSYWATTLVLQIRLPLN